MQVHLLTPQQRPVKRRTFSYNIAEAVRPEKGCAAFAYFP